MSRIEIKCINKDERNNPTESITHVGGKNSDGSRWSQTVAETIKEIENNEWQFYVIKNSREVSVEVATSRSGNKYIKTSADDYEPNNLLSLPECPL